MDSLSGIGKVFSLVHQKESQWLFHLVSSPAADIAAMIVASHARPHNPPLLPTPKGLPLPQNPHCTECSKDGHNCSTCYLIIGFPLVGSQGTCVAMIGPVILLFSKFLVRNKHLPQAVQSLVSLQSTITN